MNSYLRPAKRIRGKNSSGDCVLFALHSPRGAARCVRSHIPGALSILKGAVPDRARGLGHMAPTYFRREPGIDAPTAKRLRTDVFRPLAVTLRCERPKVASLEGRRSRPCILRGSPLTRLAPQDDGLSYSDISTAKENLRREMLARREALPVTERQQAADTIAARTFPIIVPARRHRVRLHAAQERDQPAAAAAQARRRRRFACAAGGRRHAASR